VCEGGEMNVSITDLSHILIKNLTDGRGAYIDATAGNGYDTLFIAKMLKNDGKLYSFDISERAVESTNKLLKENDISSENIKIIKDSHENIDKYVIEKKIKAAVINLGYLPGSDKKETTKAKSTLRALEKILNKLELGGVAAICSYTGHDKGEEDKAVSNYLQTLDTSEYEISKTEMTGRKNAPVLYLIIKRENEKNV
jgi:16S rRNA C1402 N4-methylase RsmH